MAMIATSPSYLITRLTLQSCFLSHSHTSLEACDIFQMLWHPPSPHGRAEKTPQRLRNITNCRGVCTASGNIDVECNLFSLHIDTLTSQPSNQVLVTLLHLFCSITALPNITHTRKAGECESQVLQVLQVLNCCISRPYRDAQDRLL